MTALAARPGVSPVTTPSRVVLALAALEAKRLLTHPAIAAGLVLTALFARDVLASAQWPGAVYSSLPVVVGPLLCGISVATALATARDRTMLAEAAPVQAGERALARLLAGLPVVGAVAVLVAVGAVALRVTGGLDLGEEPGRTLHAHHTLPELLQPVVLTAFAVAFGAAAMQVVRNRLAAVVAVFVVWFAVSPSYWLFNGPALAPFSVIQTQPVTVVAGPASADPATFPETWLLSAPGEFQDFWGRVVVSPSMAAWHDAYLVGLTLLAAAVVLRGRPRRVATALGVTLAVLGVVAQKMVQP